MAKLGKMPNREIIDGFKGLIDFYYWKGIPVARRWPRYFPRTPSPAEATTQTAFAYINRLWSALPLLVVVQLTLFAAQSTLTGKDFLVRGYIKGLYDLMPPEYYATEATQLALLAQLDVPLSTRALEAGGNLAAILAQLDVALSTRALEAGGNLAAVHARLDAIKITRGNLTRGRRVGLRASNVNAVQVFALVGKGVLAGIDFATDHPDCEVRIYIDNNYLEVPWPDGSAMTWCTPATLNALDGESLWWKQIRYDVATAEYSLCLKTEIHFAAHCYVYVRNNTGGAQNIACHAWYHPVT